MTPEEARIVAHVCGDGSLFQSTEKTLQIVRGRKYKQLRKRYYIDYCNYDQGLLDEFARDLLTVYGISSRRTKDSVRTKSKRVFDRIRQLGCGQTYDWYVSKEVFNSSKDCKRAWLRAFFDDECTVSNNPRRYVKIKSMNKKGLKQVGKLLDEFSIQYRFTGPNCDNSFYLTISRAEFIRKFAEEIGLNQQARKARLASIVKETKSSF